MPLQCLRWFLIGALLTATQALAGEARSLELADGTEMSLVHYAAEGDAALLWLPSEHGLTRGLDALAEDLGDQGVEVWLADPYTTWFLPVADSSLADFERGPLAQLIARVHEQTGKPVVLASNDRASRVVLEMAREAQQQGDVDGLAGVILISPNLYSHTPQPGQSARFVPVAGATNVPVFLMVPENSTLKLRLMEIADQLGRGGSRTYVRVLADVRDRFFFRPDALPAENALAERLPALIRQAIRLLGHENVPQTAAVLEEGEAKQQQTRTQILQPYAGDLTPPDFRRTDLHGEIHDLSDYRGQVVLLNFWASWCPPCVHEMPSMARLQERFADRPFRILAVNLGQSREAVEGFLQQVPVNFPVLLDEDKTEPKRWQVFAFPTSYLIDAEGNIRYGVAGGLEWDGEAAVTAVEKLLEEARSE